jgi:hypothetical protein
MTDEFENNLEGSGVGLEQYRKMTQISQAKSPRIRAILKS